MALAVGSRLGHYDVTALIGEGGMGQVYQATDTKLNRQVALKILPDAFAADPDRLARFQREAHVLASLNHPHIGGIHGLEKSDGVKALVLELVEGPTLADRIAQGPIPVDEALPIAKQIAEALEAAHEKGVIHRDLKPANVKVKDDGTVKVLDFGLAKALQHEASNVSASMSPTISLTAAGTQLGMVIGTAAYMAPEQAKGKVVDKRADVWAFGAVLYEMLTGRRAFAGDDVSETLAYVITKDVDWAAVPDGASVALVRVLQRCLERDPKRRLRDIGDAWLELDNRQEHSVTQATTESVVAPKLQVWQRPVPAAAAAVGIAALAGLAVWAATRPQPAPAPDLMRFAIVTPSTAPLDLPGGAPDLAISHDGTYVVYQSAGQLNLRPIDQLGGASLRGAEGGNGPFFSSDGEWLGFLSRPTTLQKVSVFGGPPVTVTESPRSIRGASWGRDDQIIFGTNAGLFRVPGGGGEPEGLTTPDAEQGEVSHRWPFVIPDANAVLFVVSTASPRATGQLAVLDLDTGEVTRLGLAGVSPHYVSTGHIVYAVEDGSVRAVPFDAVSFEVTGSPVPLVEGVSVKASGAANFGISDNGRLVYASGTGSAGGQRSLVLVNRDGDEKLLGESWQPDRYLYPRYSPDGTRVALAIQEDEATDLWVLDLARGSRSRITFGGLNRYFPVWSPEGSHLAFADGAGATNRLMLAMADGSGQIETLLDRNEREFPTSWSPAGNVLAIYTQHAETNRDLGVLPMDGDRTPVPFLETPFIERAGAFSPDGRWLAYVSDESGLDEVYVRPYPGPGQEYVISTSGGKEPVWSRDGRELFFRHEDQVLVVATDTTEVFRATAPERLFDGAYQLDDSAGGIGGVPNYDIAPDGQRFLMVKWDEPSGQDAPEITVVLNWHQELIERVPVL